MSLPRPMTAKYRAAQIRRDIGRLDVMLMYRFKSVEAQLAVRTLRGLLMRAKLKLEEDL